MKVGSANEENIAARVHQFLNMHYAFHIEQLKSKDLPVAAFSPDHVASVLHVRRGRFNAIMEYNPNNSTHSAYGESASSFVRRFYDRGFGDNGIRWTFEHLDP
ncbi:hypothetical protein PF001_g762 [Phytophthora fragariae]|nr:hypothetical protein PF001_g762 [Phytophthora fragariae]